MLGLKRKQRGELAHKAQLSKYYEMDGALRAYANRMAVLGLTCGALVYRFTKPYSHPPWSMPRISATGEPLGRR